MLLPPMHKSPFRIGAWSMGAPMKRAEDAAAIDPAATKWRYRPLPGAVKTR